MSDSEEVIPEKKGRGRPAVDKADKVNEYIFIMIFLLSICVLIET